MYFAKGFQCSHTLSAINVHRTELLSGNCFFKNCAVLKKMPKINTQCQTLEIWSNTSYWVMLNQIFFLPFLLASCGLLLCWSLFTEDPPPHTHNTIYCQEVQTRQPGREKIDKRWEWKKIEEFQANRLSQLNIKMRKYLAHPLTQKGQPGIK